MSRNNEHVTPCLSSRPARVSFGTFATIVGPNSLGDFRQARGRVGRCHPRIIHPARIAHAEEPNDTLNVLASSVFGLQTACQARCRTAAELLGQHLLHQTASEILPIMKWLLASPRASCQQKSKPYLSTNCCIN